MGVIKREDILYLSVTCGVMRNKKREIETGGYHGTFLGIREKIGEYEGKPTVRIEVKMKDDKSDEICVVQFTKEGWYSLGFFARIKKIDLTKPFTIGVLKSDQNEKMSFCYLRQKEGVKIEADKSFPKYDIVKLSGKDVQDWTKPFAAMEETIKYLNENNPNAATVTTPLAADTGKEDDEKVPDPTKDDLSF